MEKEDKNNENRCHTENIKTFNRNGGEEAVTDGSGDYVEQLFSADA
ncbi:hypothetical protein SAMN05443252_105360 [Bacillus sp. OV322]|nr:hypothetical protein [Bacillus sp. OV322]SFC70136.1 hypothetical protein SAMN05443252_105360 [Bacillus sp. OV322]